MGDLSIGEADCVVLAAERVAFIDELLELGEADGVAIVELLVFQNATRIPEAPLRGGGVTVIKRRSVRGRVR